MYAFRVLIALTVVVASQNAFGQQRAPSETQPVETPEGFDRPQLGIKLLETSSFIRAPEARSTYQVNGAGLTAAVLDTGLRKTHVDFLGRVPAERNFTPDNGGNANDASDGNGHGTNVGGIICANSSHIGIAPGAGIVPLKVLRNSGSGQFSWMADALQWTIDNHHMYNISVVNLSLGDSGNYKKDDFGADSLREKIKILRDLRVAVVVAAGNDYFKHLSKEGMSYPAIFRETVSVGAVYDANEGPFSYGSGAEASSTGPGRITPFSQRLHETTAAEARTDIFSPGAPVTSSGQLTDNGESIQHGTSQAAPVTAGVILLLQEFHLQQTGTLPTVDQLELWLRNGGIEIMDGDDEDDNVTHTQKTFIRIDALGALDASRRSLRQDLLLHREKAAAAK